jgi:ubiquinone/menaquinone biosynthesis C-methylase UbiE
VARAEYTIRGGRTDADRLARQASVMDAATLAFLTASGARPGTSCLDVGCGDGQVTVELAKIVGRTGRVVGVDVDAAALDIARAAADRAGVSATFVRADACAALEEGSFDLVFARLVLSHLVDPMSALRSMRSAARPGGVVAVEDLFTPSLHAEPPVAALARLAEVYAATVRFHGGDPAIGPRLVAQLTAAGLDDVQERTVVNRMTTVRQKLFLAELVDNMRTAIRSAGAATAEEIDELRAAVAAGAERPDTVFLQARMHQVAGRRS